MPGRVPSRGNVKPERTGTIAFQRLTSSRATRIIRNNRDDLPIYLALFMRPTCLIALGKTRRLRGT